MTALARLGKTIRGGGTGYEAFPVADRDRRAA